MDAAVCLACRRRRVGMQELASTGHECRVGMQVLAPTCRKYMFGMPGFALTGCECRGRVSNVWVDDQSKAGGRHRKIDSGDSGDAVNGLHRTAARGSLTATARGRSTSTLAAACRPESAAIGTPGPGCTELRAR